MQVSASWTRIAMIVPALATFAWIIAKNLPPPSGGHYPFGIEPIYIGLGASLLIYAAGWAIERASAGTSAVAATSARDSRKEKA